MPQTLSDALDRFAAAAGHRSVREVLAIGRRQSLQIVGSPPRQRHLSPPREIRRYWIEK